MGLLRSNQSFKEKRNERWSFYQECIQPEADSPIDFLICPLVDLVWCCGPDIVPEQSCQGHSIREKEKYYQDLDGGIADRVSLRAWQTGNFVVSYRFTQIRRDILLLGLPEFVEVLSSRAVSLPRRPIPEPWGLVSYNWHYSHRDKAISALVRIFSGLVQTKNSIL